MAERSGIDMLKELLREVHIMRNEIKVLDQNIKKIANSAKISEIATKALNTPLKDWTVPVPISNKPKRIEAVDAPKNIINKDNIRFNLEITDASKTDQVTPNRSVREPTVPMLCMCQGKMVASAGSRTVPLPGLSVKIFDYKDNVVKKTKTNRAGNWMGQLPPGLYVVNIEGKFKGKSLYPVNLNFEVKPDMKTLEVK